MDQKELTALKNTATELRIRVIDMIWKAQSGHPGGSLSVADFVTACYFRYMNLRPEEPRWPDRDRFVLSKGHVCPAQYAALAMKGFFPLEVLDTLRKEGSPLQGHPSMTKCPGIDISTGSLGQGLDNLIVFVDWNNLQLDGTCEEIMPPISLAKKFEAFGFEVYECDGNDMAQLVEVMDKALASKNGLPKCIVGKTVKGKGVSYMENVCSWHGTAPNDAQYKQAMEELNALYIKEEA